MKHHFATNQLHSYLTSCINGRDQVVIPIATLKKKFSLEGDFFDDLKGTIEKGRRFYVRREYRKICVIRRV